MIRYRIAALTVILAAASLSSTFAQSATGKVASAQREVLLQADHSWNGVPYTHYPKGRPELTMLKLTIPAHSVLPWHTHPFPNGAMCFQERSRCTTRSAAKPGSFIRERHSPKP